jgi:hypothetical protein
MRLFVSVCSRQSWQSKYFDNQDDRRFAAYVSLSGVFGSFGDLRELFVSEGRDPVRREKINCRSPMDASMYERFLRGITRKKQEIISHLDVQVCERAAKIKAFSKEGLELQASTASQRPIRLILTMYHDIEGTGKTEVLHVLGSE